jgi:hypothetical protein
MQDKIIVRGAREHNLKNVAVEMPRNSLVVITGFSGSGKSSLTFDTSYAERTTTRGCNARHAPRLRATPYLLAHGRAGNEELGPLLDAILALRLTSVSAVASALMEAVTSHPDGEGARNTVVPFARKTS